MQTQATNSKIEKAINHIATQTEDKDVTVKVSVSKDKRAMKPLNSFVILFCSNLRTLITEHKLNASEIVVLTLLCERMEYGNLISISQTDIAQSLNISKQAVNNVFRKFRKCGLLVKNEGGSEFLNAHIIAKGKLWDHRELDDVYQKSLEALETAGLSKSF